ncbi:MAG TPA: CSLREA domain-containing protein, partial [Blastocatellia bacterium]|nr:CSLREA domain-containing protein [Blastocatellia bacterium]
MLKSRKTLRVAIPCLVLVSLALALSVQRWSAHAQSEQDPPASRAISAPIESFTAQTAVPNGPTATITVNSLADVQANDGQCTLREALINANNNNQSGSTDCTAGSFSFGGDVINFSVTGTINLTGALPNLSGELSIVGPGAHLLTVRRDTGGDYRIFNIPGLVLSYTISGLTISNGKTAGGENGGGIYSNSPLTLTNCVILNNETSNNGFGSSGGGGVYLRGYNGSFTGCTFSGNTAGQGGAIAFDGGAALTLTNCTVSGNTAYGSRGGGGILNYAAAGNSTLTVINSTIAHNAGSNGGGITTWTATPDQTATTTLRNSIIAHNTSSNFQVGTTFGGTPIVTSLGNNLSSDGGGGFLNQASDKLNTDPQLLPLGNYGGTTQTHALLATSPAIDAGTATGAPANDQRGFARGGNGRGFGADGYDIGAYEVRPKFINVTTGNDANSGATLALPIKTIAHGIAIASLGDDLMIASGTYPENNLVVGAFINFQGAGAASTIVNGGQINRVFQINGGSQVGISNLTITNGRTVSGQPGGGGINNAGTLSLANCVISGNSAPDGGGGGIRSVGATASLTITNSTISGNNAGTGGAGIVHAGGMLTILNSTISGNGGAVQAGGLSFNSGTGVLTNCTISGNTASLWPGGIHHFGSSGNSSSLLLTNCTVTDNNSDGTHGGILTQDTGGAISVITQLKNTIVAGNDGPNLSKTGTNSAVTSLGNNLTSDNGGGFLNGTGDLINTNPLLAALADNGGSTKTHLLQSGSPAINAGSNTGAPATDQRGVKRPVGANTDIGAVEVSSGTCATSV